MSNGEMKRLGDYIREVDVRNRDLEVANLVGLTIDRDIQQIARTSFLPWCHVRPMPSCKSGIFMRCSVFPVASLLSFSYAPPG